MSNYFNNPRHQTRAQLHLHIGFDFLLKNQFLPINSFCTLSKVCKSLNKLAYRPTSFGDRIHLQDFTITFPDFQNLFLKNRIENNLRWLHLPSFESRGEFEHVVECALSNCARIDVLLNQGNFDFLEKPLEVKLHEGKLGCYCGFYAKETYVRARKVWILENVREMFDFKDRKFEAFVNGFFNVVRATEEKAVFKLKLSTGFECEVTSWNKGGCELLVIVKTPAQTLLFYD